VKVSAKAAVSKYSIEPASFIDFGVMLKGTRKTCTFTLENKGIFAFDFHIQGLPRSGILLAGDAQGKAVEHPSLLGLFLQAYLTLGVFTVYPDFGSIPPGGHQTVTVKCHATSLGKCEEHLTIDIQDR
ncbi:HYDIN protein, partial [Ceuthmochares aereus]|nr:HYDIN protein [Ceuthmochares aereus]